MKKRTSRLVAITLALVLCMSLMPLMAMAATNDPGWSLRPVDPPHGLLPNNPRDYAAAPEEPDNDLPDRGPFIWGRETEPEEPSKEPEKQPEKEPEKPKDDPGRIVTERFIKLIETGRGFEELWSNRESPVWTLGDIENYLARRAGRIPTAGVGFIAHP